MTTFLSAQSLLLKEGQRTERPLKVADETIFKFLEERKSAGVVDIWVLIVFYFLPLLEVGLPLCYVSFQNQRSIRFQCVQGGFFVSCCLELTLQCLRVWLAIICHINWTKYVSERGAALNRHQCNYSLWVGNTIRPFRSQH